MDLPFSNAFNNITYSIIFVIHVFRGNYGFICMIIKNVQDGNYFLSRQMQW